jgi:hypothetical protein
MVDFFVPDLSPDAAEQLYARLEKEARDKPRHLTARLSQIRWSEDGGQTVYTASVGQEIVSGAGPQGVYPVHVLAGITRVIIEAETLAHVHTEWSPAPITIVTGAIIHRTYFDDFKPS